MGNVMSGRKEHAWASRQVAEDISGAPAAVKSAARALRIIEFFDEVRRSARANEIAERLAIPQSSTSVLLNSLVRLGYLDFDQSSKSYLPSIRTAVLATWRDTGCFRDGSMLALFEQLAAETGLAATLSIREGIYLRMLHVVQNSRPNHVHMPLSMRRFAANAASGIVLLAGQSEAEIRAIVHQTRAVDPIKTTNINFADVMARVHFARKNRYCLSVGLNDPSQAGIAIGLPASITGGWQDMAIAVSGAIEEVEPRERDLVDAVIRALRLIDPPFKL
jgi:DNA-binding IclR family transcriptional regulator